MAAAVRKKTPTTKPAQKATKAAVKPRAGRTTPKAPTKAVRGTQAAKKPTRKTAPVAKKVTAPPPADMVFREGSDSQVIWDAILAGGASRKAVLLQLAEQFKNVTTRGGKPKPISTVMNYLIRRAIATGKFEVRSHWSVVPVEGKPKTPAKTKPAAVMAKKAPARRPAAKPTTRAKPVIKAPAKKAAAKKPSTARKPSRATTPARGRKAG